MSRGVNKAIIVGNLGDEPETRHQTNGKAMTNIRVITSEEWRDKQSGEQVVRKEVHRIVFFDRLAEIAGEYLRKGSQVYIEGKLQTRSWEKDGVKRYTTEIVGREMQMLGKKPSQPAGPQNDEPF